MTKCLSASALELLALESRADQNNTLPEHLAECNFCSSAYHDFVAFYDQVEQELSHIDFSTRLDVISEKAQNTSTTVYRFDRLNLIKSPRIKPVYIKTLAADSSAAVMPPATHSIGVFTSSDERLMVRILKGPDDDYSFFLLSDTKALYQNVLVRLLGIENDYISDHNGMIKVGKIDLPDLDKMGIEVRTPSSTYDMKNYFPGSRTLIGENEISVEHSKDRRFKMEIFSENKTFSLKVTLSEKADINGKDHIRIMVVKNEIHTEIKDFVKGVALFQEIEDPADLQIKIFA